MQYALQVTDKQIFNAVQLNKPWTSCLMLGKRFEW